MLYVDQMFNATAAAAALTQMNAGTTAAAGTYAPSTPGRLIHVTVLMSGQAATSLIEEMRVELSSIPWTPNLIRLTAVGGGIRTAPAVPIYDQDWIVDEPVLPQQPITANYVFNVTAVTPNIIIMGTFSTNPVSLHPFPGE